MYILRTLSCFRGNSVPTRSNILNEARQDSQDEVKRWTAKRKAQAPIEQWRRIYILDEGLAKLHLAISHELMLQWL